MITANAASTNLQSLHALARRFSWSDETSDNFDPVENRRKRLLSLSSSLSRSSLEYFGSSPPQAIQRVAQAIQASAGLRILLLGPGPERVLPLLSDESDFVQRMGELTWRTPQLGMQREGGREVELASAATKSLLCLGSSLFSYGERVATFVQNRLLNQFQNSRQGISRMPYLAQAMMADYRIELDRQSITEQLNSAKQTAYLAGLNDRVFPGFLSNEFDPPSAGERVCREGGIGVAHAQSPTATGNKHKTDEFTFGRGGARHHVKAMALFHGPGGERASENLIPYLKHHLEQWNFPLLGERVNIFNALSLAIVDLNEACKEAFPTVALIIDQRFFYVANGGDSCVQMVHDAGVTQMTTRGSNLQSLRPEITYCELDEHDLALVLTSRDMHGVSNTRVIGEYIRNLSRQGNDAVEIAGKVVRRAATLWTKQRFPVQVNLSALVCSMK